MKAFFSVRLRKKKEDYAVRIFEKKKKRQRELSLYMGQGNFYCLTDVFQSFFCISTKKTILGDQSPCRA
jgi:transposase